MSFTSSSTLPEDEPRRPAGVAVDPAPELPKPAPAASAETGLVVLKTPLDTQAARQVVKDFGLTLDAGEVVGLLGPNGAGKTTCFYMIVGLVPADAGQIVLDGKDITSEPMYARAKYGVGYLPQEPSVFRKLSVADNIRLVLELREDLDRAGRERELGSLFCDYVTTLGHHAELVDTAETALERLRVAPPQVMILDVKLPGMSGLDLLGLPIVRTSVDHGTAFDIAGTGTADPSSLIEAVQLAARLSAAAPRR